MRRPSFARVNARLPGPVRVLDAVAGARRRSTRGSTRRAKTYRYRIWNADVLSPFERALRVARARRRSIVEAMAAAARRARGPSRLRGVPRRPAATRRRPSATCSSRSRGSTARARRAARRSYEIAGDGFLRHMVRTIVGHARRGRPRPPAGRRGCARCSPRAIARAAGPTAPAHGPVSRGASTTTYGDPKGSPYGLQSTITAMDDLHVA